MELTLVSGGMTRLGAIDVTAEPYRRQIADIPGLTVVDLTDLRGADWINHNVFADSPEVVRLIGTRLMAGQVLTEESPPSLPSTAGGLVGAVIAAPIVILDSASLAR